MTTKTFEQNVAATTGALDGDYLWSDRQNWSTGVAPSNGDSVIASSSGVDDISSLSLNTLTERGGGNLFYVAANSLSVGTVDAVSGFEFYAGILGVSTPVSVTVNAIVGSGGIFGAVGGSFTDLSTTDPGENYFAGFGGSVTLSAAPVASSILEYGVGDNTFVLDNLPAGTYAAELEGINQGDVLELPGSAVTAASFGTGSLSITTSAGTFKFSNVQYDEPVTGYTATHNASTGMEVITFTGPDPFEDNVAATTGPLDGQYLWSNPENWQTGAAPVSGGSVIASSSGVDDISSLSLSSLTESGGGNLFYVAANSLSVGTVNAVSGFEFYAGILGVSTPVSVTVNTIVGSGGIFGAVGGSFTDLSTTDPGEHYFSGFGGSVTLSAAPVASSILEYGVGDNTFALDNLPAGTYAAELEGINQGDVLELPGAAVTAASFGTGSLSITTSAGTFKFSNVQYDEPVTGYTATHNASTGMEVITFTGPDPFEDNVAATTGPLDGQYLWSNPENWQTGAAPVSGGSVIASSSGVDDISSLSLSSLTESGGGNLFYVAANSLSVGTVNAVSGFEFYAGILGVSTPVSVTVNTIVGGGGIFGAVGGSFTDLSTTDPGEHYFSGFGGSVTLSAAPVASSILEYGVGDNTFALDNLPAGTYAAELEGINQGDVLELPGAAVTAASFGTGSLSITTSAGTFKFSNVQYDEPVTGYTATHNASTGMEVITFTGGPPVIASPTSDVIGKGQAAVIAGVSVSETSELPTETFTTTLTDSSGLLSATGTGVTGSGTKSLTVAGTLTQVNADLATLKDTDATTGSDAIDITTLDSRGESATAKTIGITVNGLPTIAAPTNDKITIDLGIAIPGVSLSETGTTTGETFTVTLTDTAGLLSATGTGVTGSGTKTLTVTGSLTQVNADLATLKDADTISGTDTIILAATDSLGNSAARASIAIRAMAEPADDFNGSGRSGILIENTLGAVVVGEVVNGQESYAQVGALGPEWKFVGTGDFLGDGKSDFLIENTSGAVVVGEVNNGQATYTQVAALGPEWKFVETGDFLGDGKSDFLIQNTNRAVVVGEVNNGQGTYTQVGGLGPEWSFVGAGDYAGTGIDSFLIQNSSGAVVTGTVMSGQAQYAQIAALGSEWRFHG